MDDLNKKITAELTIGHVLVLWNILSNKVTGDELRKKFSEEELRAIWSFQDQCEEWLINEGVASRHDNEWSELMKNALAHAKTLFVECLDE